MITNPLIRALLGGAAIATLAPVAAVRAQLDGFAAEYGRPSPTPLLMVFVHVTDGPRGLDAGRAEVAGFVKGQYGLPVERLERWVLVGDTDHVAKGLDELVAEAAAARIEFIALRSAIWTHADGAAAAVETAHRLVLAAQAETLP